MHTTSPAWFEYRIIIGLSLILVSGKGLLGFVVLFDAIAILILYPHLDLFAGAYLFLSTALAILQVIVNGRFSSSDEIRRLFNAKDIDKAWDKWVALLGLAEFAIFFEYSHWRPVPELLHSSTQVAGLLLSLAGTLWLVWVDSYLIEQFPKHYRIGALMTSGPYRFVRHPRYLGLLATRLALPLIFGSVIACFVAAAWLVLIRRRARLEERYLRTRFGAAYTEYEVRTVAIP